MVVNFEESPAADRIRLPLYATETATSQVTGHPLLRRNGPQLLPAVFSHSQRDCLRSLNALALLDTTVLLPGHGDVWRGPIREATEAALQKAAQ